MSTPRRAEKDGLVLSGGGAKGAYEVGILKALVNGESPSTGYQPLTVETFTGTSVGAYNAAFLVAQAGAGVSPSAAQASLETIWSDRIADSPKSCGNGVFRLHDAPLDALDPGCFFRPVQLLADTIQDAGHWGRYFATRGAQFLTSDASLQNRFLEAINLASFFDPAPLYELIESTVDIAGLRAATEDLTIAATNWEHGTLRLFSRHELADGIGLAGIVASTAIPGIFPAVPINGVLHHDGGVLLNTPLRPAIRDGADVIHMIFLDPMVVDIPLRLPPNSIDTAYRMFLIMSSALFRADLALAAAINVELELFRQQGILTADYRLAITAPKQQKVKSRFLKRLEQRARPYRPLTVHVYRPETDLDGGTGLIDFSARYIDAAIAAGYRDAVSHDCEASGCILPKA